MQHNMYQNHIKSLSDGIEHVKLNSSLVITKELLKLKH